MLNGQLQNSSSADGRPNAMTMRTGDRPCAQKLSVSSLEKHNSSNATCGGEDLSEYKRDKRNRPLERSYHTITNDWIWKSKTHSSGQIGNVHSLPEKTKTVRGKEPSALQL